MEWPSQNVHVPLQGTQDLYQSERVENSTLMETVTVTLHFGDNAGGYNYDFVDNVPDRLICNICTKPFRNPKLVVCCGQHFCTPCLENWFQNNGIEKCPHCRATGTDFQHVVHKGVKSEVEQMKIRCPHQKEGCTWTGELAAVKHHLHSNVGCDYELIPCTNICRNEQQAATKIKRKNLQIHLMSECNLRQHTCTHCNLQSTYQFIINSHLNVCQEYPLLCPNQCGASGIKRKNMMAHRSKCPKEEIVCPYAEIGCVITLPRENMRDHKSKDKYHLELAMKAIQQTQQDLEVARIELQVTKVELHQTKQALQREQNIKLTNPPLATPPVNRAVVYPQNIETNYSWSFQPTTRQ